jgi:hypothetical protein
VATDLDPRSTSHRILECEKCYEPVASSAWSGRVVLHCGYCGREEERELAAPDAHNKSAESAYRDRPRGHEGGAKLQLSLGELLPGFRVNTLDSKQLHTSIERTPLVSDALASVEYERVWIAVWLAIMRTLAADNLRARAALETALVATETPAYRAILVAHLAQHAAGLRADELLEKWLSGCGAVGVAEVDAEVRVARALLTLRKGEFEEARRATGDRRAGEGYAGNGVYLAMAINAEALEKLGDSDRVDVILKELKQKNVLPQFAMAAACFGIAQTGIKRMARRARRNDAITWAAGAAVPIFVVAASRGDAMSVTAAVAVISAAIVAVVAWTTFGRGVATKVGRAVRTLVCVGALVAIATAAVRWLDATHHEPAKEATQAVEPAALPAPPPIAPGIDLVEGDGGEILFKIPQPTH